VSYARIVLATVILITALFFLLKVAIAGFIFGAFALFVLVVVIKEGL
jgi:membrane protein required for beta-lactamase induction